MSTIREIIEETIPEKSEHRHPDVIARLIHNNIKGLHHNKNDYDPSRSKLIETMMSLYISDDSQFLHEWVKDAYKATKGFTPTDNIWVGDADVYIFKIHDTDEKVVFHVKNVCTCSDKSEWLIVWDRNSVIEKIHVRTIYSDSVSDYPKAKFPSKLSLQFYKDREYVIGHIDKYHMTNLGGVYGDVRDSGYVISLEKYTDKKINEMFNVYGPKDLNHFAFFYFDYVHMAYNLRYISTGFVKKKIEEK